ncbi:GNAT family N-acetyltransferase [Halobacterium zhouii]|uniref:GNAT family N-acetyltransferase n=1 Tax=Halobacterium zhouii TaxID=2902624 RepID=UPI001E59FA28|nr:GNAT family N-acetyltransferase [Halobacterium zhouii]
MADYWDADSAARDPTVRRATEADHLDALRILDAAMLETDADAIQERIDAGTVLVAVDGERVVGALVAAPRNSELDEEPRDGELDEEPHDGELDEEPHDAGAHVDAIAVRRRRRASGIGSRLVEAAVEHWTPLTAEFDPDVKPFYENLGFDCEATGERFRGVLD